MARTLTLGTTSRRRLRNLAVVAAAIAVVAVVEALYGASLRRAAFLDGWVLIAVMLFLAGFNMRKKLPMLPLGKASTWTQIHIYVGLFVVALFLFHTGFALPTGTLETVLWLMFVFVVASGFVGLYLTCTFPARLGEAQERILLERIPKFRAQLAEEIAAIAQRSVSDEASLTLSNFYTGTLHDFMRAPRNFLAHLRGSRRSLLAICEDIERLERYMDDRGRKTLAEIRERVIAKNDLDYQYAHLLLLRLWLFVHIPATYSLLVLAAAHVGVVYAFSSGAP